VGNLTKTH